MDNIYIIERELVLDTRATNFPEATPPLLGMGE